MRYCILNYLAFCTLSPMLGTFLAHTRGRNAHKKRANIRINFEPAKLFALIFRHLAFVARHNKCRQRGISPTSCVKQRVPEGNLQAEKGSHHT